VRGVSKNGGISVSVAGVVPNIVLPGGGTPILRGVRGVGGCGPWVSPRCLWDHEPEGFEGQGREGSDEREQDLLHDPHELLGFPANGAQVPIRSNGLGVEFCSVVVERELRAQYTSWRGKFDSLPIFSRWISIKRNQWKQQGE
jgi:hypothetical protein